jgi:hypothetical protein
MINGRNKAGEECVAEKEIYEKILFLLGKTEGGKE